MNKFLLPILSMVSIMVTVIVAVLWFMPSPNPHGFLTREEELKEWPKIREQLVEENNQFLGAENAVLCSKHNGNPIASTACKDPIIVSLLCDMSQIKSCQKIAQAIRLSDKMFLLYPFSVSKDIVSRLADYTIIVSNSPKSFYHEIVVYKGHFFDENGNYSQLEEIGRIKTDSENFPNEMTLYFSMRSPETILRLIDREIENANLYKNNPKHYSRGY